MTPVNLVTHVALVSPHHLTDDVESGVLVNLPIAIRDHIKHICIGSIIQGGDFIAEHIVIEQWSLTGREVWVVGLRTF